MVLWRRTRFTTVEEHPNLAEINAILARLPSIDDDHLGRLADAWCNPPGIAAARAKALAPDAPLVLEVLQHFEHITELFMDEIDGDAPYTSIDSERTVTALKAVRDALAAAFARPVLTPAEYVSLMVPWRTVYPVDIVAGPDLGPHADRVQVMLEGMDRLAHRCHDKEIAALFNALTQRVPSTDDLRQRARDEAWRAAVLTSRRRLWTAVRRQGSAAFARWCAPCRRRDERGDLRDWANAARHVREMCLDAACALLVADAMDETLVEILTLPAQPLEAVSY